MIPAPGLLLGRYPQRLQVRGPSAWTRLTTLLPDLRQVGRLGRRDRFVDRVRAREREWSSAARTGLEAWARDSRAYLARDGLRHPGRIEEAFALVACAYSRVLGIRLHDTQLIAARILLEGSLAEMATGEGKTHAVGLAAATAAMAGAPVHVVTANDYLVERDSCALRPMYAALGLEVGAVTQSMSAAARRSAYALDLTYCTAKELAFDYLRDQVGKTAQGELAQHVVALSGAPQPQSLLRGLCLAVIDEADSVLIDEARMPLVLAQRAGDPGRERVQAAWRIASALVPHADFRIDTETRRISLNECGRRAVRARGSDWPNARECEEAVLAALAARWQLERGRDYVIEAGEVQIVDATSGRKAPGRSWSHGVQQMVEIKEGCEPTPRTETLAQITFQRFFARYLHLCGVSGTLRESAGELRETYGLAVRRVPLRAPDRRKLLPARFFAGSEARWRAVVDRVRGVHEQGRPVLVGTDSVLDSQALSKHLAAAGLAHRVLNATQDRAEARIVAQAGAPGAITVATNMAGRGTDIVLSAASRASGGLHVLSCQQNAARRIDRQLVGRCARQGDPGTAEYFVLLAPPLFADSWESAVWKRMLTRGGAAPAWLGLLRLRLAQRRLERRDRMERRKLLLTDCKVSDWLAFGGPE